MTNLDPKGMVCRINVENHSALIQTKYRSTGPNGFREEVFKNVSHHYKTTDGNDSHGMANLDQR